MLVYLINAMLCSGMLFIVYKLFLESEKTYRFNRIYLLLSICLSLVVPLISVGSFAQNIPLSGDKNIVADLNQIIVNKTDAGAGTNFLFLAGLIIYSLISLNIAYRFIRNIYFLESRALANKRIAYKNANIVLLPESTVPHTFLNNIFISEADYKNRDVEQALLDHELSHAQQQHSLDILFVGFIEIFFWFNPVLIFYKKAIKLNHEFLADEAVLASCDVISYQQLLLEKIDQKNSFNLSSSLNYMIAKKRFIMMTKNTSTRIAAAKKIALIPMIFCTFLVCCSKEISNQGSALEHFNAALEKIEKTPAVVKNGISVSAYRRTDIAKLKTLYAALSDEERSKINTPPFVISTDKPGINKKTVDGITVTNIKRTQN